MTICKDTDIMNTVFERDSARFLGMWGQESQGPDEVSDLGNLLAFAGLSLFTFLLYARPNELLPGIFGTFPVIKLVAIFTALIYSVSMLNAGKPLTVWPLELRMLCSIMALAVLFMPFAISAQDTIEVFSETFFKIVLIFVFIINLVTSHKRLRLLLKLMLMCASCLAIGAIMDFLSGKYTKGRIEGAVGGMFSNPNDLAVALTLLVPLAVVLALSTRGLSRLAYVVCTVALSIGVLITFSRGAFLGFMAMGGFLLWRLRPRFFLAWAVTGLLLVGAMSLMIGSGSRLSTILDPDADETGSAQQRQIIFQRAALVAARHSLIGVGMGNFHHYSIRELKAHNSYLEVWAELGIAGLIAYLTLIFAPFRSLRDLELRTAGAQDEIAKQGYYLSVGLQATLAAYIVCGFFSSFQYQWYLYYPVAFSVALRTIHACEESRVADSAVETNAVGSLWPQARTGKLWPLGKVSDGC